MMETLHEMLKRDSAHRDRNPRLSEDLGRRYSKIGISAVAAATQFNGSGEAGAAKGAKGGAVARDRANTRGGTRS
jgi:hypothetical protein